jgi:predicted dehydrogenase
VTGIRKPREIEMSIINVAVIGIGYWGPNLARNIAASPDAHLHSVCDIREETLNRVGQQYPRTRLTTEHSELLDDPSVDAVIIATPAETHYTLAKESLTAGKHVLVEKPLAATTRQCRELIALADRLSRVLMVGHVFIYNAAVQKLRSYIESGELGEVYYVSSSRLNLGRIRQDINAMWNFAPHDISIINHLLGMTPSQVNARGFSYIQEGVEDVVFMTLHYPNGASALIHISWLNPRKVRRMTVVGSEKMAIYDDVSADAKIQIYDKGVTKQPSPPSLGDFDTFGEFQLLLRAGDLLIPKIDFVEPLRIECQHFIDCIKEGKLPITDGWDGLRVVQVLEAAQRSIENEGRPEAIDADST